jgi:hypothetical protein
LLIALNRKAMIVSDALAIWGFPARFAIADVVSRLP